MKAIMSLQQAIHFTLDRHPSRCIYLKELGDSIFTQLNHHLIKTLLLKPSVVIHNLQSPLLALQLSALELPTDGRNSGICYNYSTTLVILYE